MITISALPEILRKEYFFIAIFQFLLFSEVMYGLIGQSSFWRRQQPSLPPPAPVSLHRESAANLTPAWTRVRICGARHGLCVPSPGVGCLFARPVEPLMARRRAFSTITTSLWEINAVRALASAAQRRRCRG
jgi:hypothetical protein